MPSEPEPSVDEDEIDDSYADSLDDLFRGWHDGEYTESTVSEE